MSEIPDAKRAVDRIERAVRYSLGELNTADFSKALLDLIDARIAAAIRHPQQGDVK